MNKLKKVDLTPNQSFQNYNWYEKEDNDFVLLETPTHEISATITREIRNRRKKKRVFRARKDSGWVAVARFCIAPIHFLMLFFRRAEH